MTLEMLTALPGLLGTINGTPVTPVTPWWSETTAGYFGAFAGVSLGILGGCLGAAIGVLAPQGKAKGFILASIVTLIVAASALFFFGIIALIVHQPYHVWYFPVLCGTIGSLVMGPLFPVVLMRYRQAETRRMDAEAFKRS